MKLIFMRKYESEKVKLHRCFAYPSSYGCSNSGWKSMTSQNGSLTLAVGQWRSGFFCCCSRSGCADDGQRQSSDDSGWMISTGLFELIGFRERSVGMRVLICLAQGSVAPNNEKWNEDEKEEEPVAFSRGRRGGEEEAANVFNPRNITMKIERGSEEEDVWSCSIIERRGDNETCVIYRCNELKESVDHSNESLLEWED